MTRNESLRELSLRNVPRGVSTIHPITVVRADGARVWDADGREYIDLTAGIGVLNVGHNHPRVVNAARAQMERLTHIGFQVAGYEGYVRLAERLNRLIPVAGEAKTALFTTGAEAVENAVKIARAATARPAILAFTASFHGRTLLGLSLTGKVNPYKQDFGPFAPEVYHAPYPYPYRGLDVAQALKAFDEVITTQVAAHRLAAVIFEPVTGEGGFMPMPHDFMRELRAFTEAHGIILIADEIQTGFGRTGRMFAVEHAGVTPDLVVTAKSLAGGFPLSAVTGRVEVMDAPQPGGLGGTYGGNPVAVAAALASLEVIEGEGLVERSRLIGETLRQRLTAAQERLEVIGEVRGVGAMVAMELVKDRASREPAADLTDEVLGRARENGVLALKAGLYGNVVRFLTPLVISDGELDRAVGAVIDAVTAATGRDAVSGVATS